MERFKLKMYILKEYNKQELPDVGHHDLHSINLYVPYYFCQFIETFKLYQTLRRTFADFHTLKCDLTVTNYNILKMFGNSPVQGCTSLRLFELKKMEMQHTNTFKNSNFCQVIQSFSMTKIIKLGLFLLLSSLILARNLQTVYGAIVIGAGSSGIGASVALASKNVNHIILEARNRFGGRTYATQVSGIDVDLGASFVHNPQTNNAINAYVTNLNWGGVKANFSLAQELYQTSATPPVSANANAILAEFKTYAESQVQNGDQSLQALWDVFILTKTSSSNEDKNQALFSLLLQANVNGGDLDTISTKAYMSQSGQSTLDYLPTTSYAALIQKIYTTYCKNASIIYNQAVTNIDYSGSVVKVTTSAGQVYYANKVINTIPLGVLKNGDVTFTPALPTAYQTAISSIGFGIFNKIIVTLNSSFWPDTTNTRVVNLPAPTATDSNFPEFYVAPSNPKLLLFFVTGNYSKTLSLKTDSQIITDLQNYLALYTNTNPTVSNFTITRWEQEIYTRGSYSYYKVGTTSDHFKTLMTTIDNKLWFAGEHVHPNQSSNVHGAFQTGIWAGAAAAFGLWQVMTILWILVILLAM